MPETAAMIENTLTLPDGRVLGYGIYGDPAGFPVFDFHGIPGSRREAALIADYIGRDDVCFIGMDRPGYGRSSPKRNFRIVDFPGDVVALADQLKIAKFAVLGYSGGGPFALACAAQIPGRLASLAVVSGVGPADIGPQGMHESNRKKFSLAQRLPWLARLMLWLVFSTLRRQPERLARQLKTIWQQMPEPDRQVLEQDQHFADGILAITRDALTSGVSGWVQEEILMTQPWQFEMNDVRVPHVQLWHGGLDRNVPVTMGRAVAGQIPNCRATFLDNEGHISLLYHHGREIVERLIQSGFQ